MESAPEKSGALFLRRQVYNLKPASHILYVKATLRKGDWFLTRSGKQFYPLDPRPEDICIEDIIHGLSNVCRFGGHCLRYYSVLQHSVFVRRLLLGTDDEFQGLMHDATEAYLGDVVRPLKYSLPEYLTAEKLVWAAIAERYELPLVMSPMVKAADNLALVTERRDNMPPSPAKWHPSLEALVPVRQRVRTGPVARWLAKREFRKQFMRLSRFKY